MKKSNVPGAEYAEPAQPKKGRRRNKKTTKDESTEAGPSSNVPTPSPAQPGPSTQKPPTSPRTVQGPAPTSARQPIPAIPNEPAQASSSSTRPIQSSAQTSTRQAGQASSQSGQATLSTQPTIAPGPTGGLPNRGLTGANSPKESASGGIQPDNASYGGDRSEKKSSLEKKSPNPSSGKLEVVGLRGQPPRPDCHFERKRNIVDLVSNHFQLNIQRGVRLLHYGIVVDPEIKGSKLAQIIKTALNHDNYIDLRSHIVTDFSAVLLSVKKIPDQCMNFEISYQSEVETQASDNAKKYRITLDFKGEVNLSNPTRYLGSTETNSNGLPIEQALDIILGHHRKMSDDVSIINKRKAFSINPSRDDYDSYRFERIDVLIALRGYFSSVRLSESSILVNINFSHGAFYTAPQPLETVIKWLQTQFGVHRSKISGILRGLRVSSSYIRRVWSIWGYAKVGDGQGYMLHPPKFQNSDALSHTPEEVRFFYDPNSKGSSVDQAKTLSEEDKEKAKTGNLRAHTDKCSCPGKWLTVAQYFADVRKKPIRREHLGLPLVNVGSDKRPTYLPAHLCTVRPGQISNLKLDPGQTSDMIKFAVRNPDENAKSITTKAFKTLGLTPDNDILGLFGIKLHTDMVRLKGRTLLQPTLLYDKQKEAQIRGSYWSLLGMRLREPIPLNKWACVRIRQDERKDGSLFENPLMTAFAEFQKHLASKGITVEENDSSHADLALGGNDYNLWKFFKESRDEYKVRFLLVILPRNPTSELYSSIKRYGDVTFGIHTVCIKSNKFGSLPYDDNVALKINLKLGGTNHVLDDKAYGLVVTENTMIVGIDVTHPAPGDEGAPSVAAVVASRDKYLSQWPVDLRINKRRQEMVEMLRDMLKTRLEHYKDTNNNSLPKNILIYRDGVGEGQYKIVLEEELPKLRNACKEVYGRSYEEGVFPRISLIVVGKRHHTRFYKTDHKGNVLPQKRSNPLCGTLVDDCITRECNWDFFLQSHTAIAGTARPAHYFVLLDEIFRKRYRNPVEELENLTYNLCYLYGKATTSVSIPPPVYYADKACDRGRKYLSKFFDQKAVVQDKLNKSDVEVHQYLKDTMFYI